MLDPVLIESVKNKREVGFIPINQVEGLYNS